MTYRPGDKLMFKGPVPEKPEPPQNVLIREGSTKEVKVKPKPKGKVI